MLIPKNKTMINIIWATPFEIHNAMCGVCFLFVFVRLSEIRHLFLLHEKFQKQVKPAINVPTSEATNPMLIATAPHGPTTCSNTCPMDGVSNTESSPLCHSSH